MLSHTRVLSTVGLLVGPVDGARGRRQPFDQQRSAVGLHVVSMGEPLMIEKRTVCLCPPPVANLVNLIGAGER